MADPELFAFGGNTIGMNVTATSSSEALGATAAQAGKTLRIYNAGAGIVFVAPGGAGVEAVIPVDGTPANGFPIAPDGETGMTLQGGQTHIAAICPGAETATIYITQGSGI
jgi:hypothetical protein